MRAAIVIHSGGVDSTTLLHKMLVDSAVSGKDDSVFPISVVYSRRSEVEASYAKAIAYEFGVDHETVYVDLHDSHYTVKEKSLTQMKDKELRASPSVWPHRNTLLVTAVAAMVESWIINHFAPGIDSFDLYLGIHGVDSEEEAVYPDITKTWLEAVSRVTQISSALKSPPKVYAPFVDMRKHEIIQLAWDLGTPLHLTTTCYRVHEIEQRACFECNGCISRLRCFERSGLPDPLSSDDAYDLWRRRYEEMKRRRRGGLP